MRLFYAMMILVNTIYSDINNKSPPQITSINNCQNFRGNSNLTELTIPETNTQTIGKIRKINNNESKQPATTKNVHNEFLTHCRNNELQNNTKLNQYSLHHNYNNQTTQTLFYDTKDQHSDTDSILIQNNQPDT